MDRILAGVLLLFFTSCMSNQMVEETNDLMMSLDCGMSRHDAYELAYEHNLEFQCLIGDLAEGTCWINRYGVPVSTIYHVKLDFNSRGGLVRAETQYTNISFLPYFTPIKARDLCE